jgi:hypothetical protein
LGGIRQKAYKVRQSGVHVVYTVILVAFINCNYFIAIIKTKKTIKQKCMFYKFKKCFYKKQIYSVCVVGGRGRGKAYDIETWVDWVSL